MTLTIVDVIEKVVSSHQCEFICLIYLYERRITVQSSILLSFGIDQNGDRNSKIELITHLRDTVYIIFLHNLEKMIQKRLIHDVDFVFNAVVLVRYLLVLF